jgi:hypothetical protein
MTGLRPSGSSPGHLVPTDDPGWLRFDVHGLLRMGVSRAAPTAPQLSTMFADFLVPDSAGDDGTPFDLIVSGTFADVTGVAFAEDDFSYRSDGVFLRNPRLQILRDGHRMRLNGGGELLTTVLPLVDRLMVERGAAMIHAATVTIDGNGIALPAAGGVGKTSTIAKLARRPGVGFMGDDWAFVTSGGELLGFAKPMFIKPHHRPIYPHLFAKTHKPLVPTSLSRPIGRLTTMVHPVVVRYPRTAGFVRRWSPEHMMIAPRDALPHLEMVRTAPLAAAVYLERHDGSVAELRELSRAEMVARMLGNFHIEMTVHSREIVNLLGATGLVPLHEQMAQKADVLDRALARVPTFLMQVPRDWSADRASDAIVAKLETVTATLGPAHGDPATVGSADGARR